MGVQCFYSFKLESGDRIWQLQARAKKRFSIKSKLCNLGLNLKVVATGLQNVSCNNNFSGFVWLKLLNLSRCKVTQFRIWLWKKQQSFANSVAAAASSPLPSSIPILSSNLPANIEFYWKNRLSQTPQTKQRETKTQRKGNTKPKTQKQPKTKPPTQRNSCFFSSNKQVGNMLWKKTQETQKNQGLNLRNRLFWFPILSNKLLFFCQ